ncbi:MAG: qseC [Gammaproteobacteria bacterium]|jgi:two-component system sensor histidine kinase QseC|nr:qseC [Gammaproteobacteria bacterium]
MIKSIKIFLLTNLLLCIIFVTSLALLTCFLLENRDLQTHLDNKLIQSTLSIQAFMTQNPTPEELQRIQSSIDAVATIEHPISFQKNTKSFLSSYEAFQFQILDANNHSLLESNTPIPPTFLNAPLGLSKANYQNKRWRIFVTIDPVTRTKIIATEPVNFQNLLRGHIAQESIFIMLISYPFLGILIWTVINRGLKSLKKISYEIQQRAANRLDPIDSENVPLEIKIIVSEWNKLFDRLKKAFDREQSFAADAAHELKTPLAALKAHAQVAMHAKTEQELKAALQKILTSVDRSAHSVQQLLIMSRMEYNLPDQQATSVNLVQQAKEVIAELVPQALEKNSEIELIAPDGELVISGYVTAIAILIRNLIDNAIRYTPEHSLVRVILKDTPDAVLLIVTDNGNGIPEHLREQVFERFFRVLGNKGSGTGLGLGIVKQIIDLHEASIKLDTPPEGKGLQATVSFPKTVHDTKS